MLFLIEYDPRNGELISSESFDEAARTDATRARIEREVRLRHEGIDREVVILEAADEASLRVTHRRYFDTASQLSVVPAYK